MLSSYTSINSPCVDDQKIKQHYLIQQCHQPPSQILNCPTSSPTHGTSTSQWVIATAARPSNTTALSQAFPHGTHPTFVHPAPYFVEKTNGDTNARMRSTTHCSPGERDVNRRAADFSSVSGVPGVDQAGGPREKRTSQYRPICHYCTSLFLFSLSTSVGLSPISTSNPSSSSPTGISPTPSNPEPVMEEVRADVQTEWREQNLNVCAKRRLYWANGKVGGKIKSTKTLN